jgi:hypothetical protein
MVYQNKFVAEIKVNGKILRMKDGYVSLPFGSEYTILLKNLNSRKARVDISIDGQSVLDNSAVIIGPNQESELKGFLTGNIARNSFRFIQKTKEIADYRGDRADDGIIRIEYAYEKPSQFEILLEDHKKKNHDIHVHHYYNYWNYSDWFTGDSTVKYSSSVGNQSYSSDDLLSRSINSNVTMDSLGQTPLDSPLDDEGITVKGSEVNQYFNYASIGSLEDSQVLIIRLRGITSEGQSVQRPLTVKDKLVCSSCGKSSNSAYKFCPNCGTFLE